MRLSAKDESSSILDYSCGKLNLSSLWLKNYPVFWALPSPRVISFVYWLCGLLLCCSPAYLFKLFFRGELVGVFQLGVQVNRIGTLTPRGYWYLNCWSCLGEGLYWFKRWFYGRGWTCWGTWRVIWDCGCTWFDGCRYLINGCWFIRGGWLFGT